MAIEIDIPFAVDVNVTEDTLKILWLGSDQAKASRHSDDGFKRENLARQWGEQ